MGSRADRGGTSAPVLLGGIPTTRLRDIQVDLGDLRGKRAAGALAGRVASPARHPLDTACALEREMLSLVPERRGDGLLETAVAALDRPDPPSVGALAHTLGLSERQFRRRCTATVEYGPKTLTSVLRFRRAMRLATAHTSLTKIASLAGYADQAHLTREVKRLSGRTPGVLFGDP